MSFLVLLAVGGAVAIALANGANDNGKGVATLVGAQVLSRRKALWLAHFATLAGAVASVLVSRGLIRTFQGGGLLPADEVGQAGVLAVVGASAAMTVGLATFMRLPISTTHALTGALVGVGIARGSTLWLSGLLTKFVIPLMVSPILAGLIAAIAYLAMHRLRVAFKLTEQTCVCVGTERVWVPVAECGMVNAEFHIQPSAFYVGPAVECRKRYAGRVVGFSAAALLDTVHVSSATLISAARGLNDAPKLAALVVGVAAWSTAGPAVAIVALAMFLGGVLGAFGVTRTMSEEITSMNAGSAATANLVAAALVLCASLWGVPVSTTHVTCGALFGIGVIQHQAHWRAVGGIILAWVVTVPIAAAIAALLATLI